MVSVHEHQAEIAGTSRDGLPKRLGGADVRLQLMERRRRPSTGVAGDLAKLVTGAQITADKAHMLLWRRTLECCASSLEPNGATLTQFAAD